MCIFFYIDFEEDKRLVAWNEEEWSGGLLKEEWSILWKEEESIFLMDLSEVSSLKDKYNE